MKHVFFPDDLKAIRGFPGYFLDPHNRVLYSIKIAGELRPIKKLTHRWFEGRGTVRWNGWRVSVNGNNRYIADDFVDNRLKESYTIRTK